MGRLGSFLFPSCLFWGEGEGFLGISNATVSHGFLLLTSVDFGHEQQSRYELLKSLQLIREGSDK